MFRFIWLNVCVRSIFYVRTKVYIYVCDPLTSRIQNFISVLLFKVDNDAKDMNYSCKVHV